jgi:DNA-directed RNA polymerase subunit RPC12/RpoP
MWLYRCYGCGKVIGDEPSHYGFIPKHPDYGFEMDVEYICSTCRDYLPTKIKPGTVIPLSIYVEDEFNDNDWVNDFDDSLDYE